VIVGQSQPTCYLLHQLSGVVQIRLPPNVAIGAEIGVAAVGGGDHIHAQLQGFRHPQPKARKGMVVALQPVGGRQMRHGEGQIEGTLDGEGTTEGVAEGEGTLDGEGVGGGEGSSDGLRSFPFAIQLKESGYYPLGVLQSYEGEGDHSLLLCCEAQASL